MEEFDREGFEIHRGVLGESQIRELRGIADFLAKEEGKACVRGVADKSASILALSQSDLMQELLPADCTLVRSILFDKTQKENWPVLWHQDLTIAVQQKVEVETYGPWSVKDSTVHVQPPVGVLEQMKTLRVHLDETTEQNGALRVLRASHLLGKLVSSKVPEHVAKGEEVCCECAPGDILAMSPLILHASQKSKLPSRRRVLHFEYAHRDCLDAALEWA
jgi:ectoine hydroxylase-related dioxygenase (phytanoyl-CoA dioxygenase family)